ncbi:MAG: TonB family protein [Parvibaculum sedimenti]|uniref:energy transducer TonB family protein n=1 Tax=Parvibaculum sedimenti TaxID=2608632 RepID=UPI003BB7C96B
MFAGAGSSGSPWLRRAVTVAASFAVNAGLAAGLLLPASTQHVGTGAKEMLVHILSETELRKPVPVEKPLPVLEKRPVPIRHPKPAPKQVPQKPAPVVAAPRQQMKPVETNTAISRDVETRAAGIRAYGSLVWKRIAEKKPKGIHLPGTAHATFSLTREGRIAAIRIAKSSGSERLDALALRTIEAAAPFDTPPADLTEADLVFEIPLNFR